MRATREKESGRQFERDDRDARAARSTFAAGLPAHRPYRQPTRTRGDWSWRPIKARA